MYFQKIKATLAVAALAVTPLMSHATPLAPGVYNAVDDNFLSESFARSIWTQSGNRIATGGTASNLWSFVGAVFDFNGSTAKLTGSAVNAGDAALTFDFALNFNNAATGPIAGDGYCQFGGGAGHACAASEVPVGSSGFWTYLDLLSGTFTGTGAAMSGLSYAITDRSGGIHPPQAGLEANALEYNGEEGLSLWFDWVKSGTATNMSPYSFNSNGHGDINTNLVLDPNGVPSPVPLPAAGLLLLGALGALGAVRGRKQKA